MKRFAPLLILALAGCQTVTQTAGCANPDRQFCMPTTDTLKGVRAVVHVVTPDELRAIAVRTNAGNHGMSPNGIAVRASNGACSIWVANNKAGMNALEHELHHCQGWKHP